MSIFNNKNNALHLTNNSYDVCFIRGFFLFINVSVQFFTEAWKNAIHQKFSIFFHVFNLMRN